MLNSATKQADRYFLLLLGELDYLLRPLVMVFVNRRLEGRSSRLLQTFQALTTDTDSLESAGVITVLE